MDANLSTIVYIAVNYTKKFFFGAHQLVTRAQVTSLFCEKDFIFQALEDPQMERF